MYVRFLVFILVFKHGREMLVFLATFGFLIAAVLLNA